MAILTTTPTEVGSNLSVTVGCRLLAWYTGATSTGATAHLKLQAISQGTTYTGTNKDYELNLGDVQTGTVAWSYAPLNADTWYDVAEITKWMGSGSTAVCSGKVWTYVFDDAWIRDVYVTMPTFAIYNFEQSGITQIGNCFLQACYSFNAPIELPSTITSMGEAFMFGCQAMCSTINVGSLPATIMQQNMFAFGSNSGSAAQYVSGIKLEGTTAQDWKTRFPDSSSGIYRKLIVQS